jgi:hypothetical protein
MGLMATAEKKRDPIADGVYQAVTTQIIDLGTQYNEHFGKSSHQVMITWEIPELTIKFEKDGKEIEAPRVISKKYTLSLGEKANLRKDLQSWRGRAFTDQELEGFDLLNVLEKNCMLQIINTTKDGKTYSNISSILPLYKGMTPIPPYTKAQYYSIAEGFDIPDAVPQWIKDVIMKSEEFKNNKPEDVEFEGDIPVNTDVPF